MFGFDLTGGMIVPVSHHWSIVPHADLDILNGVGATVLWLRTAVDVRMEQRDYHVAAGLGMGMLDSPVTWSGTPLAVFSAGRRSRWRMDTVLLYEVRAAIDAGVERPIGTDLVLGLEFKDRGITANRQSDDLHRQRREELPRRVAQVVRTGDRAGSVATAAALQSEEPAICGGS